MSEDIKVNNEQSQPTIEQVRELLFGREQRTLETQLADLRAEVAALSKAMSEDVKQVRAEQHQANQALERNSNQMIKSIGSAIEALGRDIGKLTAK